MDSSKIWLKKNQICPFCLKIDGRAWCPELDQPEPEDERVCSLCDFWARIILNKDEPESIRVNHVQYQMELPNGRPGFKPLGGAMWEVRRFEDMNAPIMAGFWVNGPIPEEFWEDLPDNAVFDLNKRGQQRE